MHSPKRLVDDCEVHTVSEETDLRKGGARGIPGGGGAKDRKKRVVVRG